MNPSRTPTRRAYFFLFEREMSNDCAGDEVGLTRAVATVVARELPVPWKCTGDASPRAHWAELHGAEAPHLPLHLRGRIPAGTRTPPNNRGAGRERPSPPGPGGSCGAARRGAGNRERRGEQNESGTPRRRSAGVAGGSPRREETLKGKNCERSGEKFRGGGMAGGGELRERGPRAEQRRAFGGGSGGRWGEGGRQKR